MNKPKFSFNTLVRNMRKTLSRVQCIFGKHSWLYNPLTEERWCRRCRKIQHPVYNSSTKSIHYEDGPLALWKFFEKKGGKDENK